MAPLALALEDRTLLSVDYSLLASNLAALFSSGQSLVDNQVFGFTKSATNLPLIGKALATANDAQFLTSIGNVAKNDPNLGGTLKQETDPNQVWADLYAYFSQTLQLKVLNDDNNGHGIINTNDPNRVEFEFVLRDSIPAFNAPLQSDLGIPNLGLQTSGSLQVDLNVTFDLRVGVYGNKDIYLDTDPANRSQPHDLTIGLDATIPGFQANGTLGVLQLNINDGPLPAPWTTSSPQQTDFGAKFDVDLSTSNSSTKVYAQSPGNLTVTASAEPSTKADINLGIIVDVAKFVSIGTNFHLVWTFSGGNLDGDTPTVSFNDVQLDIGSFFTKFVSPIVENMQTVTKKLQPVVDVLQKPVPVLSDLSNLIGEGDVTLEKLINSDTLTTFDNAVDFIDSLNVGTGGTTKIQLGSFQLTDSNNNPLDLRSQVLNTGVALGPTTLAQKIVDQLQNDAPGLTIYTDLESQSDPSGGPLFSFPILDQPQQVFDLLLGKPATLFDCHLVNNQDWPLEKFSKFYPIVGPIGVQVDGNLDIKANFHLGYDTYGLTLPTVDPIQGLYVVSDAGQNDVAYVEVDAGLRAGPGVNIVFASADIQGGITGSAKLALKSPFNIPLGNGSNITQDGRIRLQDIDADIAQNGSLGFLVGTGEVDADLGFHAQVGVGPLSAHYDKVLAKTVLLDFNFNVNPQEPILAGAGTAQLDPSIPQNNSIYQFNNGKGGQLILNMGPHAGDRKYGDTNDDNETFNVTYVGPDPTNPSAEIVEVSAFGLQQEYEGVTSIYAEGGNGTNTITIDPKVMVPVTLWAGFSNKQVPTPAMAENVLQAGGGPATLYGAPQGKDTLIGGLGTNHLLAGDDSADVLVGGLGLNYEQAGLGMAGLRQLLIAGPLNDVLSGGAGGGEDAFVAGPGNDTMTGGAGTNRFQWQGPGPDPKVQPGDGNATITGGQPGSTNILEVVGLLPGDSFQADASGGSLIIQAPKATLLASGMQTLTMDDPSGGSAYTINDLEGTGIKQINLNLSEVGNAVGNGDRIVINGSPVQANIVDVKANPNVLAGNSYDSQGNKQPPVYGQATDIDLTIGGDPLTGGPGAHYLVTAAIPKSTDTLIINTGVANDTVSVESTQGAVSVNSNPGNGPPILSGSVYVNTKGGNNTINVGTGLPGQGIGLLDRIQGNLYIDAGTGTQNQLNVDEGYSVNGDTLALTSYPQIVSVNPITIMNVYRILRYTGQDLSGHPDGGGGGLGQPGPPLENQRYAMLIQYGVDSGGAFGAGVNLYLTRAPDTLYATDTMQGAPTTVYADGNGLITNPNDQVVAGYNPLDIYNKSNTTPDTSFLDNLLGPVTVSGIGDVDLRVFDETATPTPQYVVTATTVDRVGLLPITYQNLGLANFPGSLTLNSSNDASTTDVEGTATFTATTIDTGAGKNQISVTDGLQTINEILGPLTVNGGAGVNQLAIDDSGNGQAQSYQQSSTELDRIGPPFIQIQFHKISGLAFHASENQGNNGIVVSGTPSGVPVGIETGEGGASISLSTFDQINGPLSFQWSQGNKTLAAQDSSASGNDVYQVLPSQILRTGAAPVVFNYSSDPLSFISLAAGLLHPAEIDVTQTIAPTPVFLFLATASNQVKVGSAQSSLDTIQGQLTIQGSGTTTAVLSDQNGPSGRDYVLDAASVRFSTALPVIQFNSLASLVLNAGASASASVLATAAGSRMTVNLPAGGGTVEAGSVSQQLQPIQGQLAVNGQGGTGDLVLQDAGTPPSFLTYFLASGSVTRPGVSVVYSGLSTVTLSGSAGPNSYIVQSVDPSTHVHITAQGNNNFLIGPNTTNQWSISGANSGTLDGQVDFSSIQNLTGGTATDVFALGAGGALSGAINGGGGGDWLDYSTRTTPVSVNLTAGNATSISGGESNIQNVRGGQGANALLGNSSGNILIGGAGPDVIVGGSGRSIEIGDSGTDLIVAGSADTILIGGTTDYDADTLANDLALEAILAEWQSAKPYATRIKHILTGGGLNGSNRLVWKTTVHDDGSTNTLIGGAGKNWFFKGVHDKLVNKKPGERVN